MTDTPMDLRGTPIPPSQIAPMPNAQQYSGRDAEDLSDLPRRLAAHHAVEAQRFFLAFMTPDSGERWPDVASWMLYNYQLALIWRCAAGPNTWGDVADFTGRVDMAEVARELLEDLASPQVVGPNIWTILEWAGIAPTTIPAYAPPVTDTIREAERRGARAAARVFAMEMKTRAHEAEAAGPGVVVTSASLAETFRQFAEIAESGIR